MFNEIICHSKRRICAKTLKFKALLLLECFRDVKVAVDSEKSEETNDKKGLSTKAEERKSERSAVKAPPPPTETGFTSWPRWLNEDATWRESMRCDA